MNTDIDTDTEKFFGEVFTGENLENLQHLCRKIQALSTFIDSQNCREPSTWSGLVKIAQMSYYYDIYIEVNHALNKARYIVLDRISRFYIFDPDKIKVMFSGRLSFDIESDRQKNILVELQKAFDDSLAEAKEIIRKHIIQREQREIERQREKKVDSEIYKILNSPEVQIDL